MDKKTERRTIRITKEEAQIIEFVQKYHGIDEFSAMTLKLYQDKYTQLKTEKENAKHGK